MRNRSSKCASAAASIQLCARLKPSPTNAILRLRNSPKRSRSVMQIGEQLARMKQIGETVDHRHARLARKLDAGRMREGANHDEVDPAREVARDVLDRFALADTDILRRQINRMAAELRHAGLERDSRAQRRLLKNHRERLAAQVGMLESGLQLGLKPRREREKTVELGARERTKSRKSRIASKLRSSARENSRRHFIRTHLAPRISAQLRLRRPTSSTRVR